MKVLLARITGFVSRFYIIFLVISFLMTFVSQDLSKNLGENLVSLLALPLSYITMLCFAFQFSDKVPLQFVRIKGIGLKSKYPPGTSYNDIKRDQIKRIKKNSLYAATFLFPITLILNVVGIIMVLVR